MKIITPAPPQRPTKKEKVQKLRDLEVNDCFRFFDEVSYEDALKTPSQSFFWVTGPPSGAKPPEDKVNCMTFDMKAHRLLDGDRMVIKHEVNAAIMPAVMVDIPATQYLEDQSDTQ